MQHTHAYREQEQKKQYRAAAKENVVLADKTRHTTKRLAATTAKLKAHQQKSHSIRDHRREIHRVETELRRSLQKQNEMESEMKRLQHKYVVA